MLIISKEGLQGNGSCSCPNNIMGTNCSEKCVDSKCQVTCSCNSEASCVNQTSCSDQTVVFSNNNISVGSNTTNNTTNTFNNLGVSNSYVNLYGLISVLGNISINSSHVDLEYSETVVSGDLSLLNSTITFSNSSIIVDGCINLNGTVINVDLSKYKIGKNQQITLLKSDTNCIKENNLIFTYSNKQHECDTATGVINSDAILLNIDVFAQCSKGERVFQYLSWIFLVMVLSLLKN